MPGRMAIIALVALTTVAAAAPQEPKPAAESAQPSNRPVTILASADHVRAPTQPADASKKPRAMRVTTCRCGGPVAGPVEEPKDR